MVNDLHEESWDCSVVGEGLGLENQLATASPTPGQKRVGCRARFPSSGSREPGYHLPALG